MADIVLIAAVGRNNAIGRDNALLWKLPGDLPRFKALTLGKPVIMGRKTFESIGHALPERTNFVLTRQDDWRAEDVIPCNSLQDALAQTHAPEVFVIGGAQIYDEALPLAHTLYLTEVDDEPEADAFFPNWNPTEFALVDEQPGAGDAPRFTYRTYLRL